MKHVTLLALLLCLALPALGQSTTLVIELPEVPDEIFSPEAMRAKMERFAAFFEQAENNRRARLYNGYELKPFLDEDGNEIVKPYLAANVCANMIQNYTDNGVCPEALPIPPYRVRWQVVQKPFGWGVNRFDLAELLVPMCDISEVQFSKACRDQLGLPDPEPEPTGNVDIVECYGPEYGHICPAGPKDTVVHGDLIAGSYFPDGRARYKVLKRLPFGVNRWYQLQEPPQ